MSDTSYEMMLEHVSRDGYVVYYNHKIPMHIFLRDIENFAAGLSQLHLQKGDVVTLYLPSCPQGLVAFYACSKLGLIANIVHPQIPLTNLKDNLVKVNSKVLLFYDVLVKNELLYDHLGQILVRCCVSDYVIFRKPFFKLYANHGSRRSKKAISFKKMCKCTDTTHVIGEGSDVVCYMHSGGTSGVPKIVQLTNRSFNRTALGMKIMYHPDVDARCYNLTTLPIFHAYGLCCGIHAPLILGFSLVLVPRFNPKTVRACLKRYNVTCWSVVPTMLKKLIKSKTFDNKRALKSLDVIWCGGDTLDEALVEEVDGILSKYCPRAQLMRGYGLTEVCGVCVVNNYDHYKRNSCGKPMSTCKAEIWNEKGKVMPANEVGEIVICSQGNMKGYLEEGDECIVQKNGEDWIRTGDMGYLDEEGYLFVMDRKKRSLKIAAVNVFPSQVEACVKKLGFIDEACAVGYKYRGKQYIKVFVTLKKPTDTKIVTRRVIEICQKNLIPYSVPRFVEVLKKLPHTRMGKIDYKNLEARE